MYITVTYLRLKKLWLIFGFQRAVSGIIKQIKQSEGVLHYSLKAGNLFDYYTITGWRSEADRIKFRESGVHAETMLRTKEFTSNFKAVSWVADEVPGWKEAIERVRNK